MHQRRSATLSSQVKLRAEWIPHYIPMSLILTRVRGINSPWMRGDERGVAEKVRVMLTVQEADCGRSKKHTFQWKWRPGAERTPGSPLNWADKKHLIPETQAQWFCRQIFFFVRWLGDIKWEMPRWGKDGTRKLQCDVIRWLDTATSHTPQRARSGWCKFTGRREKKGISTSSFPWKDKKQTQL